MRYVQTTPIAYTATNVFLQTTVPRAHVGKVQGLYATLDMAGDYGGVLLMPLFMTWVSTESIFLVGGLLTVLLCAGAFLFTARRPDLQEQVAAGG